MDALTVVNDLQDTCIGAADGRAGVEEPWPDRHSGEQRRRAGARGGRSSAGAWYKVINLNLTAVFLVSQAVARLSMIPRKYGRIIILHPSPAWWVPPAHDAAPLPTTRAKAAWSTSRAPWRGMGALRNHGERHRAGRIPSKMSQGMIDKAEQVIWKFTPMKRLGTDFDLKGLAVLLAPMRPPTYRADRRRRRRAGRDVVP